MRLSCPSAKTKQREETSVVKRSLARRKDSHKGHYGHVLVLAGSRGLTGAAFMATQAAVLSGAGRVTLGTPSGVYPIVARRLTEAMTLPLKETSAGSLSCAAVEDVLRFSAKVQVAAIGPGISTQDSTRRFVREILRKINCPVVLDADGINCFKGRPGLLKSMRKALILTPHEGECRRLMGPRRLPLSKPRKWVAKRMSSLYHCIFVLKGHQTVVSEPGGRVYVNPTGNPGMASGGTGDVLTGMIAAFVAQGFDPFFAACLAVYAHGKAGDKAAREKGMTSLIATDLLNCVPDILRRLEKRRSLPEVIGLA